MRRLIAMSGISALHRLDMFEKSIKDVWFKREEKMF